MVNSRETPPVLLWPNAAWGARNKCIFCWSGLINDLETMQCCATIYKSANMFFFALMSSPVMMDWTRFCTNNALKSCTMHISAHLQCLHTASTASDQSAQSIQRGLTILRETAIKGKKHRLRGKVIKEENTSIGFGQRLTLAWSWSVKSKRLIEFNVWIFKFLEKEISHCV